MVIHHFNIFCASFRPPKADAPLIVNAYAILPNSVALKGLKTIAGRDSQITQLCGNIELPQFSASDRFDVYEPPHAYAFRERFSIDALE
jgi:hypothetical protein